MKSVTTEVCTFDEISVDLISFSAVAVSSFASVPVLMDNC